MTIWQKKPKAITPWASNQIDMQRLDILYNSAYEHLKITKVAS